MMMTSASITTVLNEYVGTIVARSIVSGAANACGVDPLELSPMQIPCLLQALDNGVQAFVAEPTRQRECSARLRSLMESNGYLLANATATSTRMVVDINEEFDIVTARNHTKTICDDLGFGASEQVKIATVVSELARNIHAYVGRGRIELEIVTTPRRGIEIRAIDQGNGIPNVEEILSGRYRSRTGMGVGLLGTKRLMDEFTIDTGPGRGTRLVVRKYV
jgi:serine/threonine-protein kinase RsbT